MLLFDEALPRVQEWLRQTRKAEKTIRDYTYSSIRLLTREIPLVDEAGRLLPPDEAHARLQAWRAAQERRLRAPERQDRISVSKVRQDRMALNAFFAALVDRRLYPTNPVEGVKGAWAKRGKPRAIPFDALQRLLAQPDVTTFEGYRDRVLLDVLLNTPRLNEVLRATTHDVTYLEDLKTLGFVVERDKAGNADVVVKLKPASAERLAEYLLRRYAPDEWSAWVRTLGVLEAYRHLCRVQLDLAPAEVVFPFYHADDSTRLQARPDRAFQKRFAAYRKAAGIEEIAGRRVTPHSLRHTGLKAVYKGTRDINIVREVARHASILTTTVYADGDDEMQMRALDHLPELALEGAVWTRS